MTEGQTPPGIRELLKEDPAVVRKLAAGARLGALCRVVSILLGITLIQSRLDFNVSPELSRLGAPQIHAIRVIAAFVSIWWLISVPATMLVDSKLRNARRFLRDFAIGSSILLLIEIAARQWRSDFVPPVPIGIVELLHCILPWLVFRWISLFARAASLESISSQAKVLQWAALIVNAQIPLIFRLETFVRFPYREWMAGADLASVILDGWGIALLLNFGQQMITQINPQTPN